MPIDYKKYHPDWKKIAAAIREREGHKCKFCGVENYAIGYRNEVGTFIELSPMESESRSEDGLKQIRIILTVAHLDHNIENNEPENLAALCQKCHLRYDANHHAKNSKATREIKKQAKTGQISMF